MKKQDVEIFAEKMIKNRASLKKNAQIALIGAFWLGVWYVLATVVDNKLLLVTPKEAFAVLVGFLGKPGFWKTIAMSVLRIGCGFVLGTLLGLALGALSYRFSFVERLMKPFMNLLKTIPVVSFVVLLLIWWGSSLLSVSICFLIVFPNIYVSTLEGLKNTPKPLLEMKEVFGISALNSAFYIYRPALKPFLYSGLEMALGMCWKSGVAAEVIGTPAFSIGEQLYLSKISLDTGGIFAWTAVIILLSLLFEKFCMYLIEQFFLWEPACRKKNKKRGEKHNEAGEGYQDIRCEDICKSYGEKVVLKDYTGCFPAGKITYLRWESGVGKTTLLRMLAGLEKQDKGSIKPVGKGAMVFQEDRLCEEYSAVKNIELVTADKKKSREALLHLLQPEDLEKPVRYLSGGQKRRVSLVRALCAESDFLLLDEPYTGMDLANIERAKAYLEEKRGHKVVIIATHI